MSDLTPHQKQALNYREHISLTANAGSGKTFVLSKRFIEIALNANIALRNIVAITFTEKAASELYKKISHEIESRLLSEPPLFEKRKLERMRDQLVSANISTIHSFCIGILREYPVQANLDANFTAIEQNTADELIQVSVEEVFGKSIENTLQAENVKSLIRHFGSKSILVSVLSSMINKRKNILKIASSVYQKSIPEIGKFFFDQFKRHFVEIINKNKSLICSNISVINDAVINLTPNNVSAVEIKSLTASLLSENEFEKLYTIVNQLRNKLLTKNYEIRKQGYLKNGKEDFPIQVKYLENTFSEIGELLYEQDHEIAELELAKLGKTIIELFNEVLLIYSEKKKKNGYLDFEDILLKAQEILANHDVCAEIAEKYKYIMVDEYQDTNEIQYEIFMPILDYLKKGNLFVVGDEKQSIYMFRDAELEIFNKTKLDITQISGEYNILNLPDSFRMAPAICLFTNYLFRRLFDKPDITFNEVNYNDLVCAKDESTPGGIEIILGDTENENNSEAELVARRLLQVVRNSNAEEISFDEIAILCRKRKSFEELEKVFNKYNIPYNIIGGKGFYQHQIIYDIYNYLSVLYNPKNDAALIGLLRSPFFSISDAEIFEISLEKKNSYWDNLKSYAVNSVNISRAFDLISDNIEFSNRFDLTTLLRKIVYETGLICVLSSKSNHEQELANLDKLINISSSFNLTGHRTLYDFICFLEDSINSADDESQASVSELGNSVKIMTLHQAKGLEYKVVFLYSCHDYSQRDTVKTKSISINKELGILTTVPINNNYFEDYKAAPVVTLHNYVIKKKNIAEIKRLFYVGITRAKNYLFISGQDKNFKYHQESFLKFLFEGLEIDSYVEMKSIESKLDFLKYDKERYFNEIKLFEINIPILKEVNEEAPVETIRVLDNIKNKSHKTQQVNDLEEDEIISATRFAVYNKCSLKYQLTYELGFLKLFKNINIPHNRLLENDETISLDFNQKEEIEIYNINDIKSRVIHHILEREISTEQIENEIDLIIKKELELKDLNINTKLIKDEIVGNFNVFMNSDVYKEIKSYPNYKNGFEIYCKERDYFLHGIINKLIFSGNKIIIVIYKTDNISIDNAVKRAEEYDNQLKFYVLLVNKLFKEKKIIESWLVFFKNPVIIKKVTSSEELEFIKMEIQNTVYNIRNRNFRKNLQHCRICYYYKNNKCIV